MGGPDAQCSWLRAHAAPCMGHHTVGCPVRTSAHCAAESQLSSQSSSPAQLFSAVTRAECTPSRSSGRAGRRCASSTAACHRMAFSFGAAQSSGAGLFGAAPAFGASSAAPFSFGAPQTSAGFSFGAAQSSAASSFGLFGQSQPASQPFAGGLFGASTPAPAGACARRCRRLWRAARRPSCGMLAAGALQTARPT